MRSMMESALMVTASGGLAGCFVSLGKLVLWSARADEKLAHIVKTMTAQAADPDVMRWSEYGKRMGSKP